MRTLRPAAWLVFLGMAASGTEPPPAQELAGFFQKLRAGEKQAVVVYGTSLTQGGAWAGKLRQWLEGRFPGQMTFINSGGPGRNSDWGVAHLERRVLAHQPGLVFLEFSYNDAHDKFHLTPECARENLDAMVARIRAQNPAAAIVLQTMNVGWDAPNGNRSASVRPQLDAFNENYRRCAADQGLPLLDHYQAWLCLKETEPARFQAYVPDGSHPTEEGSLAVTWPVIQALLEKALASASAAGS